MLRISDYENFGGIAWRKTYLENFQLDPTNTACFCKDRETVLLPAHQFRLHRLQELKVFQCARMEKRRRSKSSPSAHLSGCAIGRQLQHGPNSGRILKSWLCKKAGDRNARQRHLSRDKDGRRDRRLKGLSAYRLVRRFTLSFIPPNLPIRIQDLPRITPTANFNHRSLDIALMS